MVSELISGIVCIIADQIHQWPYSSSQIINPLGIILFTLPLSTEVSLMYQHLKSSSLLSIDLWQYNRPIDA